MVHHISAPAHSASSVLQNQRWARCVATKIQASQTEHRAATKRENGQRRNPAPSGLLTKNASKVKIGAPINAAVPIEAEALYQEKPAPNVAPNRTLAAKAASMVVPISRSRSRKASRVIGSRLALASAGHRQPLGGTRSRAPGSPAVDGPTLGGDSRRLSIEAISARRNTRPKRPGRRTQGGGPSRDGTARQPRRACAALCSRRGEGPVKRERQRIVEPRPRHRSVGDVPGIEDRDAGDPRA